MDKSIKEILLEVSENICDNFCKYRDTGDEDCMRDYIFAFLIQISRIIS